MVERKHERAVESWSPFRELGFGGLGRIFDELAAGRPFAGAGRWSPALDVTESDGSWVLTVELPGAKREVDPTALAAYLELGYVPAPLAIFRGMRKLPIASILKVTPAGASVHSYWQPPTAVDATVSATEWTERVRTRLLHRMRRLDEVVGVLGIDRALPGDDEQLFAERHAADREPSPGQIRAAVHQLEG